jgi:hypothetical protein
MSRIRLMHLVGIVSFLLVAGATSRASIVRAMDLAELAGAAEQIVVGDVLSVESAWDENHRTIHTAVSVGVQESWKGTTPSGGRVSIRQLGGTVGDIEMSVHGMARFSTGERALLFLEHGRVVGMGQGKRRLQWSSARQQWQVDAPQVSGARLLGRGTTAAPTAPSGPESLDSLRDKVRALMGK